jgi:hypothetical protein
MLVGGGIAAVLAAVAGGGLKAFGAEVPLVKSTRRQVLLFAAGAALILGGIVMNRPPPISPSPVSPSPAAHSPAAPKAAASGVTVIDFRSSEPGDSLSPDRGSGYLLVTTDIAVRNLTEPGRSLTWTGTTGTLRVGAGAVPFAAYNFTTLFDDDDEKPWLGDYRKAGPVKIGPGDAVPHEVTFIPGNTGAGRYKWTDFLKTITRAGEPNPVFDVVIATAIGEGDESALNLHCNGRVDELMDEIHLHSTPGERKPRITAACTR